MNRDKNVTKGRKYFSKVSLLAAISGLMISATAQSGWAHDDDAAAAAAVAVAVTIAPVQSVVQSLLGHIAQPTVVVRGMVTPHHYGMRPTEIAALAEAKLLVYVEDGLEPYMAKIKQAYPDIPTFAMVDQAGVTLREYAENDEHGHDEHGHDEHGHDEHGHDEHGHDEHGHDEHGHDEHGHDEHGHDEHGHDEHGHDEHGHDEHDHHAHTSLDPHLWLDPLNMLSIVSPLSAQLQKLYPEHRDDIAANAVEAERKMLALHQDLQTILSSVKAKAFVGTHDALGYFAERYALNYHGSISSTPVARLTPGDISALQQTIDAEDISCIVADSPEDWGHLDSLRQSFTVSTVKLDILGADIDNNAGLYATLMRGIAQDIADCLKP